MQQFILAEFDKGNLTCDGEPPMVGVNEHAADPHFEVSAAGSATIKENDRVLIDLWARENVPEGIYYDITWCGFMGQKARPGVSTGVRHRGAGQGPHQAVHRPTHRRRPAGLRLGGGRRLPQLRRRSRAMETTSCIAPAIRSTTAVHGNGANLDNLETKDERRLIPNSCFSIEPGIYKDGIGVRTEIDVLIDGQGNLDVEGRNSRS